VDRSQLTEEERLALSTLSRMRKTYKRKCPVCKKRFEGLAHARYCSGACKQKAWRMRNPDAHYSPRTKPELTKLQREVAEFLERRAASEAQAREDAEIQYKIKRVLK